MDKKNEETLAEESQAYWESLIISQSFFVISMKFFSAWLYSETNSVNSDHCDLLLTALDMINLFRDYCRLSDPLQPQLNWICCRFSQRKLVWDIVGDKLDIVWSLLQTQSKSPSVDLLQSCSWSLPFKPILHALQNTRTPREIFLSWVSAHGYSTTFVEGVNTLKHISKTYRANCKAEQIGTEPKTQILCLWNKLQEKDTIIDTLLIQALEEKMANLQQPKHKYDSSLCLQKSTT